jgi:hypothetical protein
MLLEQEANKIIITKSLKCFIIDFFTNLIF